MQECEVAIIADWDADGVVSAALLLYAQEVKGVFPLKKRTKVCLIPSGPRSITKIKESGECWPIIVILDIPYTQEVDEVLNHLKEHCGSKIYYFDHHKTTIEAMPKIEEKYNVYVVVGRSPTSVLLQRFLEGLNVRITPRLREFVKAIAVLEGNKHLKKEVDASEGIVRLAASISKALNQTRSSEAWAKYVRWVSNPIPFEDIKIRVRTPRTEENNASTARKRSLLKVGMEISQVSDKEVKEAARELAMSAKNLGYVKFVDARGRWEKRGSSALASAIYKIVNFPVAVLVEKEEGNRLLIIRSGRGEAESIMSELYKMGIVEDTGGHRNIAVARLKDIVTINMLERSLRKASFYAARRKWLEAYSPAEEDKEKDGRE
ncbi:MAG: phosphoesterase [Desulfurococcales archaeon]|nr:phosphoesterase [Desulfurococcales archaeon]